MSQATKVLEDDSGSEKDSDRENYDPEKEDID